MYLSVMQDQRASKAKDFLIPEIDYRSRIWYNYFGILGHQCSSTPCLFGYITILICASLMSLM